MNTMVSLLHEPRRRAPWIVRWWTPPDPETGRQKRPGRAFLYCRDAKAYFAEKRAEIGRNGLNEPIFVALVLLIAEFTESRLARLSYASRIGYENTFTQLLAYFGQAREVHTVEQRHAEAFIAGRGRVDGRPGEIATWTRARHLIHCRSLFAAAVAWGYIEKNPFKAGAGDTGSPLRLNPKGRPWHHITPAEFVRLLSVVQSARQRAAYWLMYACGLRPGEVYNLTTHCVDLTNRRIHVMNRAGSDDLPPFTVKAERQSGTSKERSVPLPVAAIPDLTEAMRAAFQAGGLVVVSAERFQRIKAYWRLCQTNKPWGGHKWRPWQNRDMVNNMLRDTKQFLRRAGIDLTAPFTLHTLRKSFGQNHADAGTPPRTLAKLLGHSDTRVTMQYYNRVTDANERAAGETMDRMFSEHSKTKDAV